MDNEVQKKIEKKLEYEERLKKLLHKYSVTVTIYSPNQPWNNCWHVKTQQVMAMTAFDALRIFRLDDENVKFLTCGSSERVEVNCLDNKKG